MEQATATPTKAVGKSQGGFQRVLKGNKERFHDLYKLEAANYKMNHSYKFKAPDLKDVVHCHYFHSIDRKGEPAKECSENAGHFHYIETKNDGKGNVSIVCGPAMRKVIKKKRGKEVEVIEPVFYGADKHTEEDAIVDDHVHQITYVHSESLKF